MNYKTKAEIRCPSCGICVIADASNHVFFELDRWGLRCPKCHAVWEANRGTEIIAFDCKHETENKIVCPQCGALDMPEVSGHLYFDQNRWALRCKACKKVWKGEQDIKIKEICAEQIDSFVTTEEAGYKMFIPQMQYANA